jgi:hypothetical protein
MAISSGKNNNDVTRKNITIVMYSNKKSKTRK